MSIAFDAWVKRETDKFLAMPLPERLKALEELLAPSVPPKERSRLHKMIVAGIQDIGNWHTLPKKDAAAYLTRFVNNHIERAFTESFQLMLQQLMFEALLGGLPGHLKGYLAPQLRKALGLRENDDLVHAVNRTFCGPLKRRMDSKWSSGRTVRVGQVLSERDHIDYFQKVEALHSATRQAKSILRRSRLRQKAGRVKSVIASVEWPDWVSGGEKAAIVTALNNMGEDAAAAPVARRFAADHTRLKKGRYRDRMLKGFWLKGKKAASETTFERTPEGVHVKIRL